MAEHKLSTREYWIKNQRLIAILLVVWFLVSFVFSIFLAKSLYGINIGKLPASFWWAHQGSMFVFVALIFIYAWRMDKLDREHNVDEEEN
ncbi:MAG: DUF4212 domain-containing protein [Thermoanaerobaculia bacterium]|nr:DUF4212 domain-containing protein [Thermoanaerobaculia bacterium]